MHRLVYPAMQKAKTYKFADTGRALMQGTPTECVCVCVCMCVCACVCVRVMECEKVQQELSTNGYVRNSRHN